MDVEELHRSTSPGEPPPRRHGAVCYEARRFCIVMFYTELMSEGSKFTTPADRKKRNIVWCLETGFNKRLQYVSEDVLIDARNSSTPTKDTVHLSHHVARRSFNTVESSVTCLQTCAAPVDCEVAPMCVCMTFCSMYVHCYVAGRCVACCSSSESKADFLAGQ